jgi:hypothetical protein
MLIHAIKGELVGRWTWFAYHPGKPALLCAFLVGHVLSFLNARIPRADNHGARACADKFGSTPSKDACRDYDECDTFHKFLPLFEVFILAIGRTSHGTNAF